MPPNLRCDPNSGAQRNPNTPFKNKALLTWRLADIHDVFRKIHHQKFKTKSLYTMTHKTHQNYFFAVGLSCTKRTHLWQNFAFVVLNKFAVKPI